MSFADLKNEFQDLKNEYLNLNGLDEAKKDVLSDRLYKMIQYAIGRHDWYEKQKQQVLTISLAFMTVSGILATLLVRLNKYLPSENSKIVFWLGCVLLFLTGFIVVVVYIKNIERDHPYRKVSDIKSWYFKYTLSNKLPFSISKSLDKALKEVKDVNDLFKSFLGRWVSLTDDDDHFIHEDLEQVFILQLLQRYRAQQLKSMQYIFGIGLIISCAVFFLGLLLLFP